MLEQEIYGIEHEGLRYPLTYEFWAKEDWKRVKTCWEWREVKEQVGWQVGVDDWKDENHTIRAIVKFDSEDYCTSIDFSKLLVISCED